MQMVLIWTVAVVVCALIMVSSAIALVVRTARRGVDALTGFVSGGGLRRAGVWIRAHLTSMAFALVGWTLLDLAYYGFPTTGSPSWADRVLHATIAVAGLIAFRLSEHLWSLLTAKAPARIDCHHCDEPTVSGHCWWCGGPAPRWRP